MKRWIPPKCAKCGHTQLQHGDKHWNRADCNICNCLHFVRRSGSR